MYTAPQKKFRARDEAEVLESIRLTGERYGDRVQRVFLADGDATGAADAPPAGRSSTPSAVICPAVRRISSYCLPRNLRKKSQQELDELAAAGLAMVYVGAESGDDEVLAAVNKGETFETTRDALDKLGAAGIRRSVMILNGLGGKVLSAQHAENSARLANATQPEYLSTLVVSFPLGEQRFRAGFPGWEPLGQHDLFVEMEQLLVGAGTEADGVPQRSRLELAGAQGHIGRRQGTPAGAGAPGHRRAGKRPPAPGLGARAVGLRRPCRRAGR